MISADAVTKLATKYQTTQLNVWREYFQNIWLSYFYQQPITKDVWFKGGTALRIIYHSPRFSEDLDFSADKIVKSAMIESAIVETLNEIQKENIPVTLSEAKKTSGGYLAAIIFTTPREKIKIHLEISMRREDQKGELVTIVGDFTPAYPLMSLALNQLVEEKIEALLFRKKPRDYYDLYYILRANLLPVSQRKKLSLVLSTLAKTKVNFESELKMFLPKSHWGILRDFNLILAQEIRRSF